MKAYTFSHARTVDCQRFHQDVARRTSRGVHCSGRAAIGVLVLFLSWPGRSFSEFLVEFDGACGVVFVPLVWIGLMSIRRVVYEAPKDNTIISTSTFFERLRHGWWAMLVLWATPVVAVVVLGHALLTRDLIHPEMLSTSLGKAAAIFAVVFCLGRFYFEMFSGRDQPAVLGFR